MALWQHCSKRVIGLKVVKAELNLHLLKALYLLIVDNNSPIGFNWLIV